MASHALEQVPAECGSVEHLKEVQTDTEAVERGGCQGNCFIASLPLREHQDRSNAFEHLRSPDNPAIEIATSAKKIDPPGKKAVQLGSLEWLRERQTHPDAVENIVSKLHKPAYCATFALAIAAVLFLLPLVSVILVVCLLLLPPIVSFYLICPKFTRSFFGILDASTHDVAEWMLPQKAPSGLPAKLRGILYMRLNPFCDDLTTLERSTWDSKAQASWVSFYQTAAWSVERGLLSFVLMVGSRLIGYRYNFVFNEDITEADIRMYIFCVKIPAFIATYRMSDVSAQKDGSLWERWTLLLGRPIKSYWVEKVVDGVGARTSYWSHVENEVDAECWSKGRPSQREMREGENIA